MTLRIKLLRPDAKVPTSGSELAAGLDLYAAHYVHIRKFERALIPCGFQMSLPSGYYMRIAPRSGLALRLGLDVMAGVIDADYRGEVAVLLMNLGSTNAQILKGDRIAQGIITPCMMWEPEVVDELESSARGEAGYGSTGR